MTPSKGPRKRRKKTEADEFAEFERLYRDPEKLEQARAELRQHADARDMTLTQYMNDIFFPEEE